MNSAPPPPAAAAPSTAQSGLPAAPTKSRSVTLFSRTASSAHGGVRGRTRTLAAPASTAASTSSHGVADPSDKKSVKNFLAHWLMMRPSRDRLEANGVLPGSGGMSAALQVPPYEPQLFGVSLSAIVHKQTEQMLGVPEFLRHCFLFLTRYALGEKGLFRIAPDFVQLKNAKIAWDQGKPVKFTRDSNPHIVACLLKTWFREMPEPVLLFKHYPTWMGIMDLPAGPMRIKAITHLANALPLINRFVLYELLLLCRMVVDNAAHNMMNASNVSKVIAPNLLWQDPSQGIGVGFDMADVKRINELAEDMINHLPEIFSNAQYTDFLYKLSGPGSVHCCIKKKLVTHKRSITVMIPAGDSHSLYTVDSAGTLQRTRKSSASVTASLRLGDEANPPYAHCAIDLNRERLIIGTSGGIFVVNTEDLSLVSTAATEMTSVCVADGVLWAGGHDQLFFLHPSTFEPYDALAIPDVTITAMCYVPSTQSVWAAGSDGAIRVFSCTTKDCVAQWQIQESTIRFLLPHQTDDDRESVWVAGDSGQVTVLDPTSGSVLREIAKHQSKVRTLSPIGSTHVISAGFDSEMFIWDVSNFSAVASVTTFHTDTISSVVTEYNYDEAHWSMWSASFDRSVCLWRFG